ncbi:MAG TPA: NUDIX domain-containing protein [Candidatus Saccharimonadales bacterium]|nr:NUDIX domain-containing protein [Candidatus Saccharimonadales bacterium]
MAEDQQFYIGQKAVIEKDGKVLVLNDPVFGGDLPGGKIQIGETDFIKSLQREVLEESGLNISIGRPFHTTFFQMPLTTNTRHHRNIGKRIYIIYFTAKYISGEIVLSDEHDGYIWVDKKDYLERIHDKLGNTTKALEVYFSLK